MDVIVDVLLPFPNAAGLLINWQLMTFDRQKPCHGCAAMNSAANCTIRSLLLALVIFGMPLMTSFGQATIEQSAIAHPDVPFGDLIHRPYDTDDGLPSNWIHDVLHTHDGYLWVATHNGVARFDGVNFTNFDRGSSPQLPANDSRHLYESRDGTLWIGTIQGLVRYRSGRPGGFERIEELSGESIQSIFEDSSDVIWIGTRARTWRAEPGQRFQVVEDAPDAVWSMLEDSTGMFWLGSRLGLFQMNSGGIERVAIEELPTVNDPNTQHAESLVRHLSEDASGNLLIGTVRGLLVGKNGQFEYEQRGLDQRRVGQVMQTRSGKLFVIAGNLYQWNGESFERGVHHGATNCITEDKHGGLWVGNGHNGGLHYYRNQGTSHLFKEQRIFCLFEDPESSMWFGSPAGLHRLKNGAMTDFGVADGLPEAAVQSICAGSDDKMWIGMNHGLASWSGGKATMIENPLALTEMNISALYEDASGVLWIGLMGRETFTLNDGVLSRVAQLHNGNTHFFHEDSQGNVLIGNEIGLFQANEDGVTRIQDPSFDRISNHFHCHYASADGALWMGTPNGLARYRSGHFDVFTSEDGLAADYIQLLHADNIGNLWMGGRHGFFTIAIHEFDEFVTGRIGRLHSRTAEENYGIAYVSGLRGFPKACLARDGTSWIATGNGVMKVQRDPLASSSTKPRVHIEKVRVDGHTESADQPFEYLSGEKRISVDFAAPHFANPSLVQISYKLDGHDEEWIDAGDRRNVSYTDLRPGQYAFRVKADNGHGVWSEEDAVVGFTVSPRWWEIVWLRVAALMTVCVTALAYFRYRLKKVHSAYNVLKHQISERERAEEESRQHLNELARVSRAASMGELSSSIAHEVKQPLFAILNNAQAARRLLDREPPDLPEIRGALEDIASDGNRASNIIDHIRSLVKKEHTPKGQLNLNDVARDVIKFAKPELGKRGLVIEEDFAKNLPVIKADPIELQQVILNLILNGAQAMKHNGSKTDALKITTMLNNGTIELAVKDSGVGLADTEINRMFEPFYTTKQDGTGMGLAINWTIIEAHGGQIWATENEDRGATFHISLPTGRDNGQ